MKVSFYKMIGVCDEDDKLLQQVECEKSTSENEKCFIATDFFYFFLFFENI